MALGSGRVADPSNEPLPGLVTATKHAELLPGVPDYADVANDSRESARRSRGQEVLHMDERIKNTIKHSFAELRSSLETMLRDCLREEFQSLSNRNVRWDPSLDSLDDSNGFLLRPVADDALQEPGGKPPSLIDATGHSKVLLNPITPKINDSDKSRKGKTTGVFVECVPSVPLEEEAEATPKSLPALQTVQSVKTAQSVKGPSKLSKHLSVKTGTSASQSSTLDGATSVSHPSRITLGDLHQIVRHTTFQATIRVTNADGADCEDDEFATPWSDPTSTCATAATIVRTRSPKKKSNATIAGLRKSLQTFTLNRRSQRPSFLNFEFNESLRRVALQTMLAIALVSGVIVHLGDVLGAWSMHVTQLERQGYLVLSLGGLASFILLQASPQCKQLISANGTLAIYSEQWELPRKWRGMMWYSLSLVALWVLTLLCHPALVPVRALLRGLQGEAADAHDRASLDVGIFDWASFACIAAASGFILALTHHLLHVSLILALGIDSWCVDFFEMPDVDASFNSWNILQMLMRDSSEAVASSVYGLLAWLAVSLLLTASEAYFGRYSALDFALWLLPQAALGSSVMIFFVKAADISWKCARVPSLIISLPLDVVQRQNLVDFIVSTDAGFFLGEAKVTPVMIAKASYIAAILIFALTKHQISG